MRKSEPHQMSDHKLPDGVELVEDNRSVVRHFTDRFLHIANESLKLIPNAWDLA